MNELLLEIQYDPDLQLGLVLLGAAVVCVVLLVRAEMRERRRPHCAICLGPNGDRHGTIYGRACWRCRSMLDRWRRGHKPVSPGVAARQWYGNKKPLRGFDGDGWRNG